MDKLPDVSEPVNYIEKEVQLLPEMETLFPDLGASVEEEVVAYTSLKHLLKFIFRKMNN